MPHQLRRATPPHRQITAQLNTAGEATATTAQALLEEMLGSCAVFQDGQLGDSGPRLMSAYACCGVGQTGSGRAILTALSACSDCWRWLRSPAWRSPADCRCSKDVRLDSRTGGLTGNRRPSLAPSR